MVPALLLAATAAAAACVPEAPAGTTPSTTSVATTTAPTTTTTPTVPTGLCHPAYAPCLPIGPDLDCIDVGHKIKVLFPGFDPYRLARGTNGCESYPDPPGWPFAPIATPECHPAYSPCIPVRNDMNCSSVGHKVRVLFPGGDPYALDGDSDGVGCQSYPDPPDW